MSLWHSYNARGVVLRLRRNSFSLWTIRQSERRLALLSANGPLERLHPRVPA